ncbi:hypothetical protein JQK87_04220 [Streptomyces sp. G44]|uniref:hypothetical protein n=1 Tax=Streptomyces sp. G44 TaxID=2807632 RepID=UPI001961B528|nr:hypothetical protein [Streptomyces sp. G44]MBM7167623.1 hypothetical protein [Streptomyces sp. G44]
MSVRKHALLAVATAAVALGMTITPTASAAGQQQSGEVSAQASCNWPYVCFYKGSTKTGQFKDVTSGYQDLQGSRGATKVVNTRNDDAVLLRRASGGPLCILPNYTVDLRPYGTVTGIRILNTATC